MADAAEDGLVEATAKMLLEEKAMQFDQLVRQASKLVSEGNNLAKAVKQAKKAVALLPEMPSGHRTLGSALEANASPTLAAEAFLLGMDKADASLSEESSRTIWAECASSAYAMLVVCPDVPRPTWWEDAQLLRLSERAVQVTPESLRAQKWRADVLSGLQSALPEYDDRTPQQLRDAAVHFQEVARLHSGADAKRGMVKAGIACRARADAIEAHLASLQQQCQGAGTAGGVGTTGEANETGGGQGGDVEATYEY